MHAKVNKALNFLFVALALDMLVTIIIVASNYWAIDVLSNLPDQFLMLDESDFHTMKFWESFSKISILTTTVVGVAILYWTGACYDYARKTFGIKDFKHDFWKIIGWLIPILNLIKPYQVLSEIYRLGSFNEQNKDQWKKSRSSKLLLAWWLLWVITHLLMLIIYKLVINPSFNEEETVSNAIGSFNGSNANCIISLFISSLWFIISTRLNHRLVSANVRDQNIMQVNQSIADFSNTPNDQMHSENTGFNLAINLPIDSFYAVVAEELENGQTDKGLWTRLYVENNGDNKKTRLAYIKIRVAKMISNQ